MERRTFLSCVAAGLAACRLPAGGEVAEEPVAAASLAPWEPISEDFRGCEGG